MARTPFPMATRREGMSCVPSQFGTQLPTGPTSDHLWDGARRDPGVFRVSYVFGRLPCSIRVRFVVCCRAIVVCLFRHRISARNPLGRRQGRPLIRPLVVFCRSRTKQQPRGAATKARRQENAIRASASQGWRRGGDGG